MKRNELAIPLESLPTNPTDERGIVKLKSFDSLAELKESVRSVQESEVVDPSLALREHPKRIVSHSEVEILNVRETRYRVSKAKNYSEFNIEEGDFS